MDITSSINDIVQQLLPSKPLIFNKPKYINDPVWGTVEISPFEQSIIDTQLLQRLRHIHQTGFTYYTYPTAHHTRFEHSLGVLCIAKKVYNVLKDKFQNKYPSLVTDNSSFIRICLAALLHDIGHSAYSHTTEEFYSNLLDINDYVKNNPEYESKGKGEVISSLIVRSESFRNFFNILRESYSELRNIEINDVSNLIIAKPKSDIYGYEADIISGPIDADKLDYFPRDGRAAGLDISLDIHRLINCVELQEMVQDQSRNKRLTLVINKRGYNPLQQLLFARAALTASVYHHHKVRACDAMLKNIMDSYVDERIGFNKCLEFPNGIDLSKASNFLIITDSNFVTEVNNLPDRDIRKKLLNDLLNRRLFKKVLKISYQTISTEEERSDPDFKETLENLQADLAAFYNLRHRPLYLKELKNEIHKESSLDISKYEVAIDIPKTPNLNKAGDAPINNSSFIASPEIVTLKDIIPIKDWVKGYENFFGNAYVYGPIDARVRASLAISSAKVFKEKFNLIFTTSAISEDIRDIVLEINTKDNLKLFK